jgi:hypothetical protein
MQRLKHSLFLVLRAFSVPPGSSLLAVFADLLASHSYLRSTTWPSVAPPVPTARLDQASKTDCIVLLDLDAQVSLGLGLLAPV